MFPAGLGGAPARPQVQTQPESDPATPTAPSPSLAPPDQPTPFVGPIVTPPGVTIAEYQQYLSWHQFVPVKAESLQNAEEKLDKLKNNEAPQEEITAQQIEVQSLRDDVIYAAKQATALKMQVTADQGKQTTAGQQEITQLSQNAPEAVRPFITAGGQQAIVAQNAPSLTTDAPRYAPCTVENPQGGVITTPLAGDTVELSDEPPPITVSNEVTSKVKPTVEKAEKQSGPAADATVAAGKQILWSEQTEQNRHVAETLENHAEDVKSTYGEGSRQYRLARTRADAAWARTAAASQQTQQYGTELATYQLDPAKTDAVTAARSKINDALAPLGLEWTPTAPQSSSLTEAQEQLDTATTQTERINKISNARTLVAHETALWRNTQILIPGLEQKILANTGSIVTSSDTDTGPILAKRDRQATQAKADLALVQAQSQSHTARANAYTTHADLLTVDYRIQAARTALSRTEPGSQAHEQAQKALQEAKDLKPTAQSNYQLGLSQVNYTAANEQRVELQGKLDVLEQQIISRFKSTHPHLYQKDYVDGAGDYHGDLQNISYTSKDGNLYQVNAYENGSMDYQLTFDPDDVSDRVPEDVKRIFADWQSTQQQLQNINTRVLHTKSEVQQRQLDALNLRIPALEDAYQSAVETHGAPTATKPADPAGEPFIEHDGKWMPPEVAFTLSALETARDAKTRINDNISIIDHLLSVPASERDDEDERKVLMADYYQADDDRLQLTFNAYADNPLYSERQHVSVGDSLDSLVANVLGTSPGSSVQGPSDTVAAVTDEIRSITNSEYGDAVEVDVVPLVYVDASVGKREMALFEVENEDGETYLVDATGSKYEDIEDYRVNNFLAESGTLYVPDSLDITPNAQGNVAYTAYQANADHWTDVVDPVMAGISLVATIAAFIPPLAPLAAPIAFATGGYWAGRSAMTLQNMAEHGRPLLSERGLMQMGMLITSVLPMASSASRLAGLSRLGMTPVAAAKVSLGAVTHKPLRIGSKTLVKPTPYLADATHLMRSGGPLFTTARGLDYASIILGAGILGKTGHDLAVNWDKMSAGQRLTALSNIAVGIYGTGMGYSGLRATKPIAPDERVGQPAGPIASNRDRRFAVVDGALAETPPAPRPDTHNKGVLPVDNRTWQPTGREPGSGNQTFRFNNDGKLVEVSQTSQQPEPAGGKAQPAQTSKWQPTGRTPGSGKQTFQFDDTGKLVEVTPSSRETGNVMLLGRGLDNVDELAPRTKDIHAHNGGLNRGDYRHVPEGREHPQGLYNMLSLTAGRSPDRGTTFAVQRVPQALHEKHEYYLGRDPRQQVVEANIHLYADGSIVIPHDIEFIQGSPIKAGHYEAGRLVPEGQLPIPQGNEPVLAKVNVVPDFALTYRGPQRDKGLIDEVLALPDAMRRRVLIGATAADPADPNNVSNLYGVLNYANHVDPKGETIRIFGGGENTWSKEGVDPNLVLRPDLRNPGSIHQMLSALGDMRGAINVHIDNSRAAMIGFDGRRERLLLHHISDYSNVPDLLEIFKAHPDVPISWAHGGGLGRTLQPGRNHTQFLRTHVLENPELDHVFIDMSWDVVSKYVIRTPATRREWAELVNAYPSRFMYGSDSVAGQTPGVINSTLKDYVDSGFLRMLDAPELFLAGNFDLVVETAADRVTQWRLNNKEFLSQFPFPGDEPGGDIGKTSPPPDVPTPPPASNKSQPAPRQPTAPHKLTDTQNTAPESQQPASPTTPKTRSQQTANADLPPALRRPTIAPKGRGLTELSSTAPYLSPTNPMRALDAKAMEDSLVRAGVERITAKQVSEQLENAWPATNKTTGTTAANGATALPAGIQMNRIFKNALFYGPVIGLGAAGWALLPPKWLATAGAGAFAVRGATSIWKAIRPDAATPATREGRAGHAVAASTYLVDGTYHLSQIAQGVNLPLSIPFGASDVALGASSAQGARTGRPSFTRTAAFFGTPVVTLGCYALTIQSASDMLAIPIAGGLLLSGGTTYLTWRGLKSNLATQKDKPQAAGAPKAATPKQASTPPLGPRLANAAVGSGLIAFGAYLLTQPSSAEETGNNTETSEQNTKTQGHEPDTSPDAQPGPKTTAPLETRDQSHEVIPRSPAYTLREGPLYSTETPDLLVPAGRTNPVLEHREFEKDVVARGETVWSIAQLRGALFADTLALNNNHLSDFDQVYQGDQHPRNSR